MGRTLVGTGRWLSFLSVGLLLGSAAAPLDGLAAPLPSSGMGPGAMGLGAMDQRFIVMMIPHHDGAIAMAELALVRSRRPEIRRLAEQIKASQTAENAEMRLWYRQWFAADVPAWPGTNRGPGMGMGMGSGMGMGHGMGMAPGMGMVAGMPGMATSLDALKTAVDVDRAFIEQMIPHHRMGVMMASHAQWNSQHRELRDLQAEMVRAQSQEIAQMEQWYRLWFGLSAR